MIALVVLVLGIVVLFAVGGWQPPSTSFTTGFETQRIDSNIADLLSSRRFQHFAFEAHDAPSYEAARQSLTPAQLSAFLDDTSLDADPETLRRSIAVPVMLSHTWERPMLADGDCSTCETEPWAGRRGTLVRVERDAELVLDHLRGLQQR